MTENLSTLIATAQQAYQQAAVTYQGASIDQQVASKEKLDQAGELLVALQTKQLQDAIEVSEDDIAEMKDLRDKINDAAALQTALTSLVSILLKFI